MVNLQLCYVPGRLKILIIFLLLNSSFGAECPASNIANVKSCPENKTHWDSRASEKRCGSFQPDQTCKLVYHCVLNQWSNGTVEVCAPTWFISGYCAMFSLDERRIKDNFSLDCTKFREPCASRYISTDAYKYKSCYDTISLDEKSGENVAENKSYKFIVIVLISTVAVVLMIVVVAIGIFIQRKKKRKRKPGTEKTRASKTSDLMSGVVNTPADRSLLPRAHCHDQKKKKKNHQTRGDVRKKLDLIEKNTQSQDQTDTRNTDDYSAAELMDIPGYKEIYP